MDRLLTLEEPSDSVSAGHATVVWTERGRAWAKMELAGGVEQGVTARSAFQFEIHHRSDLAMTSRWRVGLVGTERKFQLSTTPADPDGHRRKLTFTAVELFT